MQRLPDGSAGVFHDGEIRVQERSGVRALAARVGRSIHSHIPDRAAEFLKARRMLVVASADGRGQPWASLLTGAPGFVRVSAARTLRIDGGMHPADPGAEGLRAGARIGTLAIDFAGRRRVRVNGTIHTAAGGVLEVGTDQVYANCPKYIQRRTEPPSEAGAPLRGPGQAARTGRALTAAQLELIAAADTFFIATLAPHSGADASHRGGNPGFVRATSTTLMWPDYAGNSMFNTLGNIDAYPHAGLTFMDFASGTTVQLTGTAAIDWAPDRTTEATGAERWIRVEILKVVEIPDALPAPMELLEYSPFNPDVARSHGAEPVPGDHA